MLTVSGPKQANLQHSLFPGACFDYEDQRLNIASSRNFVGDFFEEATAAYTYGTRLKTDCTKDVCPDICVDHKSYAESKSIGKSGCIIVYQNRLMKDLNFCETNDVDITYMFWRHRYHIEDGITLRQLRDCFAAEPVSVTEAPLTLLADILRQEPIKVLNSKHSARGYGSYGYNDGWNIRLTKLQEKLKMREVKQTLTVYGRKLSLSRIHA